MKKTLRALLLAAGATLMLGTTALAADPIEVQVNDQPIVFADAQPEAKDGRTYIPMRATFNALGFMDENILWDGATKTVKATRDDLTVSLTLGEKKVTVTKAGETTVFDTDAAAYATSNRTMVPVRFVAEAAGCNVGWDADDRVVIIDDIDALLAANTETYTLMEQYTEYGKSFGENIGLNGVMNMVIGVADQMGMEAEVEFEAVSNQSAIDMTMDMTMETSIITDAETGTAETTTLETITVEACGDLGEGLLYVGMDMEGLSEMLGLEGAEGNVWLKFDMNAMMDMVEEMGMDMDQMLGMDYDALMDLSKASMHMSFEETLAATLKLIPLTDYEVSAGEVLALINSICADSSFETDGNDYVNVVETEGVEMILALHKSGNKINGMTVNVMQNGEEIMIMSMEDKNVLLLMAIDDPTTGAIVQLSMEAQYSKAKRAPVTAPPADAMVIDIVEMLNELVTVETAVPVQAEPIA